MDRKLNLLHSLKRRFEFKGFVRYIPSPHNVKTVEKTSLSWNLQIKRLEGRLSRTGCTDDEGREREDGQSWKKDHCTVCQCKVSSPRKQNLKRIKTHKMTCIIFLSVRIRRWRVSWRSARGRHAPTPRRPKARVAPCVSTTSNLRTLDRRDLELFSHLSGFFICSCIGIFISPTTKHTLNCL